jgi:gliding motility-associated-like protein
MQYLITQNCDGVNSDPEMIILNSIEQTLNDITVLSARNDLTPPNTNITRHFLNIIIKTSALGSLTIDGAPYTSTPVAIPTTQYSYLQEEVTASTNINPAHRIKSDSGFIAIAYGYGNVESYGYNAGTNVRDLYQFISIQNQYATVNFPAACKNSPFYFSMTFPYQPTQIIWNFNGLFPNDTLGPAPVPAYDSTWFVNGKQLYRYKLPTPYTISTPASYPIQVIAQNPTPDGCSGQQIIDYNLVVYDSPVASFNFTNNGCVTDSVHFFGAANNTSSRPVINWSWNFGDAATASIQNPVHKYNIAGVYNAKFSFITDVGCLSDTAMNIVTVNTPPTAKFGASLPQCLNQTVTFTDSSTAAAGSVIVKWYWNFGDGSPQVIATSNTPQSHSYSTTGTFIATLKVETATGCQGVVFSKNILIQPNPLANFIFSNACLPLGTAQFTDQSTVASGTIAQWSWNFGDGGNAVLQNPSHNFSSTGPFNVSLKVTTNNGCVDSITKVMNTVYAQPQANFNAPAEVCHGTAINFTDQSAAPNSTVTQWAWNFGDGSTSTQQNPSKTYAAPGTYTVTLVVTSAIGCISTTATKSVLVNPLPTANFNLSAPVCATRNISFIDASLANAGNLDKWTWDFGDGSNAVYTNANPFIHVYAIAGTYNATLQVETNKGCISTILTKQVVVNVLPKAGFISPEVCLTDPAAPFVDTSSVANGSIVGWNWNFGDPNANLANPNTSAIQNPAHRYSIVGSYNATLIVTTNQGCKDTVAQTFTVNGSIPLANFTVQNANGLCSNRDITLTDASTVDFGSIVKVEIYWDYANDPTIKTINNIPQPGQNYTHLYPEFGTPFTKTYTVRMVSYSGINCLSVITKTVNVLATPSVQFNSLQPVCADVPPFLITQASITNALPGSGVFSGTGISPAGMFNPASATPGIYTIRYTYTGANTCTNYKEQTIQVFPVPTVSAGPDRFMLQGGSITLLGSGSGNGISYLWTPNISIDSVTRPTPRVSPPDDIYYKLTVTSSDGCTASDTVFVKVLKAPVVPNIFSPNGDGIHDKWEIAYLESYPGCTVDVFNRYGQLIYHSVGYDKPWDGTVNGKPVPVGTYYYIVDPKNGRQKAAGYVDVIR